jgi:hypothetical protein
VTTLRPVLAMDPRRFGRRNVVHALPETPAADWSADARLFASTFATGFLLVSFLIF